MSIIIHNGRWYDTIYDMYLDEFEDVENIDEIENVEITSIRKQIANEVEEKMIHMCGCRNCIEKIKMIIIGDVKPIKNQCEDCQLECISRINYEEAYP